MSDRPVGLQSLGDSDRVLSLDGKHNNFRGNQCRLKRDRKAGVPFGYYRPATANRTNLAE